MGSNFEPLRLGNFQSGAPQNYNEGSLSLETQGALTYEGLLGTSRAWGDLLRLFCEQPQALTHTIIRSQIGGLKDSTDH